MLDTDRANSMNSSALCSCLNFCIDIEKKNKNNTSTYNRLNTHSHLTKLRFLKINMEIDVLGVLNFYCIEEL